MREPPRRFRRVTRLIRVEAARLRGRWGPILALAVPVLVASAASLGYRGLGMKEDPHAIFNGWGCAAQSAGAGLTAGAFVLLLLCSQLLAHEASSGVLRSILCWPVKRGDVFLVKGLWALFWAAGVFTAVWAVSLLWGAALFGFGDVEETIRYGGETVVLTHHTAGKMGSILAWTILLSLPPLCAVAFLGLACSAMAVRPAPALVAAIAVYLPLEVFLKHFSDRLSPFLFVTYTGRFTSALNEFARGFSTAQIPSSDVRLCLLSSAVASILFLFPSLYYFVRRDVIE